jgi:hypothetical protein
MIAAEEDAPRPRPREPRHQTLQMRWDRPLPAAAHESIDVDLGGIEGDDDDFDVEVVLERPVRVMSPDDPRRSARIEAELARLRRRRGSWWSTLTTWLGR